MSINIKMNRHDICVSVQLSNSEESEYEVNTNGFLSTLEDFLSKLDLYDNVDIEIKRVPVPPVDLSTSDWPFDSTSDTITISATDSGSVLYDDNMNRGWPNESVSYWV